MAKNQKKNKVVIVEDDEDLLQMLLAAFKTKGFTPHGFSTGKEALDYLLDEKNIEEVALVVLDRLLPDMDGLDILKQLNKKFDNRVHVLILSVLSAEKDVLEGIKIGAVDYIAKPFSLPVLMQKANSLISR